MSKYSKNKNDFSFIYLSTPYLYLGDRYYFRYRTFAVMVRFSLCDTNQCFEILSWSGSTMDIMAFWQPRGVSVPVQVELCWLFFFLLPHSSSRLVHIHFSVFPKTMNQAAINSNYVLSDQITLYVEMFGLIVISPFVEEMIFRGVLMEAFSPLEKSLYRCSCVQCFI